MNELIAALESFRAQITQTAAAIETTLAIAQAVPIVDSMAALDTVQRELLVSGLKSIAAPAPATVKRMRALPLPKLELATGGYVGPLDPSILVGEHTCGFNVPAPPVNTGPKSPRVKTPRRPHSVQGW